MSSMGNRARRQRQSYEGLLRAGVLALITLGHLALLMFMLRPASPRDARLNTDAPNDRDVVRIRFIARNTVTPSTAVVTPIRQVVAIVPTPAPRDRRHVETARTPVAASRSSITPSPPVNQAPIVATTPSDAGSYVAGGANFQRNLQGAEQPFAAKVPGGYVPRAPTLQMVDPRDQGAAGIARVVQSWLGAVDPHCVDADAYAGMTTTEQIAHHVTPDDIAHLREQYECVPIDHVKTREEQLSHGR